MCFSLEQHHWQSFEAGGHDEHGGPPVVRVHVIDSTFKCQPAVQMSIMNLLLERRSVFAFSKNLPLPVRMVRQHFGGDVDQQVEAFLVCQSARAQNQLGIHVI